jgi:hypothetical protein
MPIEEAGVKYAYGSFSGKLEVLRADGSKLVLKPGEEGYLEHYQSYLATQARSPKTQPAIASPKVAARRLRIAGLVAVLSGAGLRELNWLGTDSGTYYSVRLNLMASACASLGCVLFLFPFWKKKPHGNSWLERHALFIAFSVIALALSIADLYWFKTH